jgi:hypothetical protein
MQHFSDFLVELERVNEVENIPERKVMLKLLRNIVTTLSLSIRYQKMKVNVDYKIDCFEDDDFLFSFFGSHDIKKNEQMMKELRKRLREIS